MASFKPRQIAARIFMLVAVTMPCPAIAQVLFAPNANEELRQTVEMIQEMQAEHGADSADLIHPLATVGLLYQEDGDHALAAAAIERARQVARSNYGLHSLEQAPLLRQSIHIEEARSNHAAAWDLEQELLALLRRHGDDLRTVPIFHEIGDRRMEVLDRYLAGEFPPEIILGCYYGSDMGRCNAGRRGAAVRRILGEALRNYRDAIEVILRHELYSSDELRELEMKSLRSSYLHGSSKYWVGKQSLRRLLAYEVESSGPKLDRIDLLIQTADWELLFAKNGAALEMYEQAYAQLEQSGLAQTSIEKFFSPRTPVVLPTFLPNPLASEKTQESRGHIDVAFDVTRYGSSRRIRILDTTNATKAAKQKLVRLISGSQFRPRVTGGKFVPRSSVVMRYYLNE